MGYPWHPVLYCCGCSSESGLNDGPPQQVGRDPAESTKTGPQHRGPAPGAPLPRRKTCQVECKSYAKR
ncbi:unnamed protein product [Coregonus sp. 'balchen']|nr:unnamed protein product [Coregonus sp. 'balchen']